MKLQNEIFLGCICLANLTREIMSSFNSYQNKEFHITLDPIDDGHTPGGTSIGTQIATYHNKANSKFLSVFDGVLPDLWCDRLYEYALQKGKPWGKPTTLKYLYSLINNYT